MSVRRKVLEEVVKEMYRSIVVSFLSGSLIGGLLAYLYLLFSHSPEKAFHCIVIFGFVGVTFPSMTTLLRLSVKGYFLGYESMENQNDLIQFIRNKEDKVDPIIQRAESIVADVERTVKRLSGDGAIDEALNAIRQIPAKLDAMAFRGKPASEAVNVPVLNDPPEGT